MDHLPAYSVNIPIISWPVNELPRLAMNKRQGDRNTVAKKLDIPENHSQKIILMSDAADTASSMTFSFMHQLNNSHTQMETRIMAAEKHLLSKSTFIRGMQCEKSLFLHRKKPGLRDAISPELQRIFSSGTDVGILARDFFPGGSDASPPGPYQHQESLLATKMFIAGGTRIIYEAAFQHERVLSAMDILVNDGTGWRAYEVKSSTAVTETYILDASLQYHVITESGISLRDISIVYIDNQYVRRGPLEISRLFTMQSVLDEVVSNQETVRAGIERLNQVIISKKIPEIDIGPHCFTPYECDFMGYCWQHVPENSVFDVARLGREAMFGLYRSGIVRMEDIPDDFPLSESQRIQIGCQKTKKSYADIGAIASFLESAPYPLYFMDFETFMPAVPLYDGTVPYQQIPFQYSLQYLETVKDEPAPFEYLAEAGADPRPEFIRRLLEDTALPGSIVVYNRAFEETRLAELARDFPDYAPALLAVAARLVDLMIPFQKKYIYTPDMRGSYSIKRVLPSLLPDMSYKGLAVSNGTMAMAAFERLQEETDREKVAELRKNLLEYCAMDTKAMVALFRRLERIVEANEF